jgi:hypothetical protein
LISRTYNNQLNVLIIQIEEYWHINIVNGANNEIIAPKTVTIPVILSKVNPSQSPFMFENWTPPTIFPVGAILFHFLFLLIAIPIEAYVFNTRLKFDKKTSIFYATAVNLFSSVIGWIAFFMLDPILPIALKSELINYVFFNSFKLPSTQTFIILTAFIIFFATFLMKFLLLRILLMSLNDKPETKVEDNPALSTRKLRRVNKLKFQNTNLVITALIANSLSYSAITIILLIRLR